MRLTAFSIRNYRSIRDSGWVYLSDDNITALIGQNESGKTSVLEGIRSFFDGLITDDIIRSDLSMPSVSCRFYIMDHELADIDRNTRIPAEIRDKIRTSGEVVLLRTWNPDRTSVLSLAGDSIVEAYRQLELSSEASETQLLKQVNTYLSSHEEITGIISKLQQDIQSVEKNLESLNARTRDLSRQAQRARDAQKKNEISLELDRIRLNSEQEISNLDSLKKSLETRKESLNAIREKVFYARLVQQSIEKQGNILKLSDQVADELRKERITPFEENPRMQNSRKTSILQYEQQQQQILKNLKLAKEEANFNKKIASRIFEGMDADTARAETMKELSNWVEFPSRETLAEEFFRYAPSFELFEDFSSLLPNRIDLDDLLDENPNAEGLKAARNFLMVAGLDARFFDQQNNRILKQKIENLNTEITVNFQDYWRQNVGKNSKIKLHFELEHYDVSVPEKKGKPYLEFWIKDEKERLYPKQRSRGVRWFLSFWLELKARALENKEDKLLLIDEPGLSLHARAQEDVLKVFEDIKEKLMVVYTTHSPHLINVARLNRLLAVQRASDDQENSDTIIIPARELSSASPDTLSPIYTLLGVKISDQQYINKYNNLIVEDIGSYYLVKAFCKLAGLKKEIWAIPASGMQQVPVLANLLLGWKLDFLVLLSGTTQGKRLAGELRRNFYAGDELLAGTRVMTVGDEKKVLDLFSTIDFKNHVLHKRVGITESNSEYIESNDISPVLLGMEFYNSVVGDKITMEEFDSETRENIFSLIRKIEQGLR